MTSISKLYISVYFSEKNFVPAIKCALSQSVIPKNSVFFITLHFFHLTQHN